jgi:DNA-binding beta-propeller fold protein YncE
MKNKGIVIFLIVLAVVIVAVIVGDYLSDKPDKTGPNPFEYNVDNFKTVDSTLIHFKESKNFRLGFEQPAAISSFSDKLYIAGDSQIQVIDISGNLLNTIQLPGLPKTLDVTGDRIYAAINNQIFVLNHTGEVITKWETPENGSSVTAIAASENVVYVADAGKRKVLKYNTEGELLLEFDGKADEGVLHGFIIPSGFFDLDFNPDGDLWVVNPGMHSLENYTADGNLREHWNNTSMMKEGFSGCCNPAHFTFLPDGRFVTSEKGLVRVKTYKPSGEFDGVVAAPVKFAEEGKAPDVATDSAGNVYALDFDKKMIRVFEPKN